MRRFRKQMNQTILPLTIDELEKKIKARLINPHDLSFTVYEREKERISVFYIPYLADQEKIDDHILEPLLNIKEEWSVDTLLSNIPLSLGSTTSSIDEMIDGLNHGKVHLYVEQDKKIVSYEITNTEKRPLEKSETESIVLGPQTSFNESIVTNLNVISWRLNTPDLALDRFHVGKRNPKETRMIYLKSVANETDVETMKQRLNDINLDMVEDIHMLKQYMLDNSTSVFPQFVATELIDRAVYAVKSGKIIVLIEDSPLALIAPSSFFSFFESTEDRYFHWNLSTFIILLRFLATFVTLLLTPMYVVATTYHYELIPSQLLISLGQSRAAVPFPPILEVLILELLIELLREAGARLPTKVGQTIGIVGGVVIGTAAVQAGITSNVLIILVTLSALASFTTPSYIMGNTIRFIRMPLIILAGFYGLIGLMFGICFLVIHLVRLESLGRPYLTPLYPLRLADFNKVFYRLPKQKQGRRFLSYKLKDQHIFNKQRASKRHDIDE